MITSTFMCCQSNVHTSSYICMYILRTYVRMYCMYFFFLYVCVCASVPTVRAREREEKERREGGVKNM